MALETRLGVGAPACADPRSPDGLDEHRAWTG
jgi:hypothetical protein